MMEFTDRVLILRVGKFRETDLWVRFLSPKRGILSAFAFGGSRSRRRFSGCLDVFNDVLFSIKTTRNGLYNALQEGTLMGAPVRLRSDWQRLGVAANCVKFVEAFGVAPDGAQAAYALVRDALAMLEDGAPLPINLPVLFRARFVFDQGYSMNLTECFRCGKTLRQAPGTFFLVREGRFACSFCPPSASDFSMAVHHETLDALAHVQDYSPPSWRGGILAVLPPAAHRECARVVDAFVEHHVGLHWDTSRFVRV